MVGKKNLEQVKHTADLFNEIFSVSVNWDNLGTGIEISRRDLETLADLSNQLLSDIDLLRLWRCVLLLDSLAVRRLYELSSNGEFRLVDLSEQASSYALDYIGGIGRSGAGLERPSFPRRTMPTGLSADETALIVDQILDQFLKKEEKVLASSGLNQSSVKIVMGAIRRRLTAIRRNIVRPPTLRADSLTRLGGQLKDTYSMEADGRRGRVRVSQVRPGILSSVKVKLVALATLWGDAVPLLTTNDLNITGVISTVAGATVGAILPDR